MPQTYRTRLPTLASVVALSSTECASDQASGRPRPVKADLWTLRLMTLKGSSESWNKSLRTAGAGCFSVRAKITLRNWGRRRTGSRLHLASSGRKRIPMSQLPTSKTQCAVFLRAQSRPAGCRLRPSSTADSFAVPMLQKRLSDVELEVAPKGPAFPLRH